MKILVGMMLAGGVLCLWGGSTMAGGADREAADWETAERNGVQANQALRQSRDFVRGWLAHADPVTGLIPRNLDRDRDFWNGRDAAADNYPFMVLTCALVDRGMFSGRMLDMLRTEQRLTNRQGSLVDDYSFPSRGFRFREPDLHRMIFESSEYVKDGLMPLTEWLGSTPWRDRMVEITDSILRFAPEESEFGSLPSINPEVNGEMMQVCSRLFWMTGERRYLDQACRIADYYLLGGHHPSRDADRLRLRDHGCELISGLTEVYVACHFADAARMEDYRAPLHTLLDRILEVGVNEHGMMYNVINPRTGEVIDEHLSDNWGYNYNGFYAVYLVDGDKRYRQAILHAMENLDANYRNYPWEGTSHDGYADTIECALNLYQREPVPAAGRWIDSEMQVMLGMQRPDGIIGGWHGDGNFARTAILYALWKQAGVTLQPWRADLRLGAVAQKEQLLLRLSSDWPWSGRLVFDQPRHKTNLNLPLDYPRINQFPEWFTADKRHTYHVMPPDHETGGKEYQGVRLLEGLPVEVDADHPLRLVVAPAKEMAVGKPELRTAP